MEKTIEQVLTKEQVEIMNTEIKLEMNIGTIIYINQLLRDAHDEIKSTSCGECPACQQNMRQIGLITNNMMSDIHKSGINIKEFFKILMTISEHERANAEAQEVESKFGKPQGSA